MKAIHNFICGLIISLIVVVYLKDTEKWKQFTTKNPFFNSKYLLLCISKILKNESNSQHISFSYPFVIRCCVSQRYWKMKAIHNIQMMVLSKINVVVYLKDTEKWKQFTTCWRLCQINLRLLCISKILKNESNSQLILKKNNIWLGCCVSQRYWKMKAIHNSVHNYGFAVDVVVYLKDTEKWKQFTTVKEYNEAKAKLLCISKILKNESNSQRRSLT